MDANFKQLHVENEACVLPARNTLPQRRGQGRERNKMTFEKL